jgi:hypothetical protein
MITREQVADLRPGDIVELSDASFHGAVIRGSLWNNGTEQLNVGAYIVRDPSGSPYASEHRTLTVISRAPRPFYVNHDRDHPVLGDAVRDADDFTDTRWWRYDNLSPTVGWPWQLGATAGVAPTYYPRESLPRRLRLLIDGTTGLPPEEAR